MSNGLSHGRRRTTWLQDKSSEKCFEQILFPRREESKSKNRHKTHKEDAQTNEWVKSPPSEFSLFFFSIEQTAELGVLTCCSPYNPSSHLINLCARTACIYNSVGWISPAKLFAIAPFMQCVSAYTRWVYGNPQTFKPLLHISDAQHKYRRILLPPPRKKCLMPY